MITKQEYMDLKKRRAEIALILRQRKKLINIDQHFLSKGNTTLNIIISNLHNSIQIFKQELKWLDILLRDTKEQLRNRYAPPFILPINSISFRDLDKVGNIIFEKIECCKK